jgi:hypothetical protein
MPIASVYSSHGLHGYEFIDSGWEHGTIKMPFFEVDVATTRISHHPDARM